ncbi:MAG: DsbA family protein [Acidobacteria bacterium]|nr:DsbA family protein [Acidobacteriota bacterium]
MTFLRRAILVLVLICLGCSAQSVPPETASKVERHIRAYYNLPADVQVKLGALKASEFANFDAIQVTLNNKERKQEVDFLLSKDGKQLIRITKLDLTKDPYEELMKKIDTAGRPSRGNKSAKVVAVNYDDFECPYCSRMHQTLFPEILNEYGDRVLFVYKDYPLAEIHPWAIHAAVNANCLVTQNNDAYWDYADYLHANRKEVDAAQGGDGRARLLDKLAMDEGQKHGLDTPKLEGCIKAQKEDAVRASMKEADGLGVAATPTLFINGQKVDGAVPLEDLRAALDRALKDAGVPVPPPPTPSSGPTRSKPTGE